MRKKRLDGLYLAVFREGKKLSVCVDYSYIADNQRNDGMGENRKQEPDNRPIKADVFLINDNYTLFAGTGEESDYVVKSMTSVIQDILRLQQEEAGVHWYEIENKALYSGATYIFGKLESSGMSNYFGITADMGLRVESFDFENNRIRAVDALYNLNAMLLKTGDEVLEMMRRSGLRLWTNLYTSQRYTCEVCNDIAQRYIQSFPEEQGGQPQQEAPEIPNELNTAKARELIKKAVEAGFITVEAGRYGWNGEKVLLAYFAVKATDYLGLKKRSFKAAASWKPFESLFQVKSLRQSKADYEKWNPELTPADSEKIDILFKE